MQTTNKPKNLTPALTSAKDYVRRLIIAESGGNTTHVFILLGAIATCVLVGYLTSIIATSFQYRPMILVGLPVVAALGFLFFVDKRLLLVMVLVLRAGLDPILEASRISIGSFNTGVGAIFNGAIILLAISLTINQRAKYKNASLVIFGPFLLLCLLGVIRSPTIGEAVKSYLSLLTYCAAFAAGLSIYTQYRSITPAMKIILASSVIPVITALIMLITGWKFGINAFYDDAPGTEGGRFAGPFTHPNIFAFYLLTNIAILLYIWEVQFKGAVSGKKIALIVYLTLLTSLLVLTKTRSAWAACLILLVMHGVFFNRRLLFIILIGMPLAFFIPEVQERVLDLFQGNTYYQYAKLNSYAWRKLLWQTGIDWMSPHSYLFGNGGEAFKFYTIDFFPLAGNKQWAAHNAYIQIFFELGVLGLIAFSWIFWTIGHNAVRTYKYTKQSTSLSVVIIFVYLIICYSDNILSYLVFNIYFWFLLGSLFAFTYLQNEEHSSGSIAH